MLSNQACDQNHQNSLTVDVEGRRGVHILPNVLDVQHGSVDSILHRPDGVQFDSWPHESVAWILVDSVWRRTIPGYRRRSGGSLEVKEAFGSEVITFHRHSVGWYGGVAFRLATWIMHCCSFQLILQTEIIHMRHIHWSYTVHMHYVNYLNDLLKCTKWPKLITERRLDSCDQRMNCYPKIVITICVHPTCDSPSDSYCALLVYTYVLITSP